MEVRWLQKSTLRVEALAPCFRIFQNVTLFADNFIFFGHGHIRGEKALECRSRQSWDYVRLVQSMLKVENLKRTAIEANAIL